MGHPDKTLFSDKKKWVIKPLKDMEDSYHVTCQLHLKKKKMGWKGRAQRIFRAVKLFGNNTINGRYFIIHLFKPIKCTTLVVLLRHRGVKDLALSLHWLGWLLWHGFHPWPGNFLIPQAPTQHRECILTSAADHHQQWCVNIGSSVVTSAPP